MLAAEVFDISWRSLFGAEAQKSRSLTNLSIDWSFNHLWLSCRTQCC